MVDVKAFASQCERNPSVAVPTTVLVIDPLDVNTQVVLQRCNLRCMVIKRTAGQACRGEQRGKRVLLPQPKHYLRFFCAASFFA